MTEAEKKVLLKILDNQTEIDLDLINFMVETRGIHHRDMYTVWLFLTWQSAIGGSLIVLLFFLL